MIFYRLFANYTLVCHSTSLCLCSLGCLLKACIFIKWSWLLLSVEAWWISTLLLGGVSLIYFQSTVILGLCRSGPLPGFDPEIRKYVNMYSMPLIETGLIVSRWLESIGKYNYVVWVGYKWIEMRWVNFKICISRIVFKRNSSYSGGEVRRPPTNNPSLRACRLPRCFFIFYLGAS